jgi:hypothetical protein
MAKSQNNSVPQPCSPFLPILPEVSSPNRNLVLVLVSKLSFDVIIFSITKQGSLNQKILWTSVTLLKDDWGLEMQMRLEPSASRALVGMFFFPFFFFLVC